MPRVVEARFDWRKSANLSYSEDVLGLGEVRRARNTRAGKYGALQKRAGTQRVHVTAIGSGSPVLGLQQWEPDALQLVGIAGGNLYHKIQGASNFTEVVSAFSATVRPSFATHHESGAPVLYIAEGALSRWDGVDIAGISGAPDALRIKVYKTRLFALDGTSRAYWSRVDDPETWTSPDGGSGLVQTYSSAGLVALEVAGGSLFLFKPNAVARYTGVTAEEIRISQDTEGISSDIGTIAPGTVIPFDKDRIFFMTDRGPYWATESGVKEAGVNIEPAFDDAEMDHMPNAVAVHHRGRREVWTFFPENEETTNTVGYCFNYRLGSWTGPWEFSGAFDVCSATRLELDDGKESVALGGYDGLVRRGDVVAVGAKDDVLRAGTGGTNITLAVDIPELLFGDPRAVKKLMEFQELAADLGAAGSASIIFTSDLFPGTQTVVLPSKGAGVREYPFRITKMFKRGSLTIEEATAEIVSLNGLMLEAGLFRRVA